MTPPTRSWSPASRGGGERAGAAEDTLCRRYGLRICLYGLKHLRAEDAARDLVQSVLLGVLEAARAGRIDDPSRLDRFVLGDRRAAFAARWQRARRPPSRAGGTAPLRGRQRARTSMSAPQHPVARGRLVDDWSSELTGDEECALEEHLMGCDVCTRAAARVAAVIQAVRGAIPPLLTAEALAQLVARGLRVVENPLLPDQRCHVVFPAAVDILLHRLGGLALDDATRVRFALYVEENNELLLASDDAPFDRVTGSVLLACQPHFASFPPNVVAELETTRASGALQRVRYTIRHRFERCADQPSD